MFTFNEPRIRRPYQKKEASKLGALIFGLGLGAVAATMAILVWVTIPNIGPRLNNLPYYARTFYRKVVPHPEYLPTPMPTASAVTSGISSENEETSPPEISLSSGSDEVISLEPTSQPIHDLALPPPEPAPAISELPPAHQIQLSGIAHQWQTWNNCGPATITMQMSYFGRPETQVEAAQFLKPNRDDKNVSPYELASYARTTGLKAIVRQGGTISQLKLFLSNNLPVLAETWLLHEGDGLGHYRLITGYDDQTGQLNTFDSLNGPDYKVEYEQFDSDWRVFNRLYIVVFPAEQTETVSSIIGQDMNDTAMYERILTQAQTEVENNPEDAIAYFNQGEALTRLGRFQEAVTAFDRARQLGLHWRRLWYQFTPFEAYYAAGRYQDVLDLTEATLKGTGGLEEAYYYHGLALIATGQPGAKADFEAALEYNPHFRPAAEALAEFTAQ